jgi:hypothetical protein
VSLSDWRLKLQGSVLFSSAGIKGSVISSAFEFSVLECDDNELPRNCGHKTTRDPAPYLSEQLCRNYFFFKNKGFVIRAGG